MCVMPARGPLCKPGFTAARSVLGAQRAPHPALPHLVWPRRRGGDVIVIGLEKDAGAQRGRVVAVLKARELTAWG